LSVDIQKIHQLKSMLGKSPAYVTEMASLLRDIGAEGLVIAWVLELYPEAVLCSPEQQGPTSTTSSLHLNKRINKEMVHLELRGNATNMKIWLQKLLSQNPFVLLKPSELLSNNLLFLETRGFTTAELLRLLSKLRGFVTKLNRDSMRLNLAYSKETLGCSEAKLRDTVLNCPALLYYPETILAERFEGLLRAGSDYRDSNRSGADHTNIVIVCKFSYLGTQLDCFYSIQSGMRTGAPISKSSVSAES
uniref:Mitochondrial transcription termination factor 2 n=1 Tax=Salmo trutta TaxID=8032 RepID=A0A674F1G4_SALTR